MSCEIPPGITCPACRESEMNLTTNRDRPALACANCGVLVRLLQRDGDEAPAVDFADPRADTPPRDCWWLAFVKGGDGIVRPVALAKTLAATWDAALYCSLRGAIYVTPTDAPKSRERQLELPMEPAHA